jgi:DNA primase
MKRFTQNELFELRNHIPISALIADRLNIPSKTREGQFRFLCPLCGEFQTATNATTNLARCFRCEKNFNTIDMVMTCENTSFIETVHTLKAYREKLKAAGFNLSQEAPK